MSETITLARPYAKAIFEYALAVNKLNLWSKILHYLAVSLLDEEAKQFITHPTTTAAQQIELLMVLFSEIDRETKAAIENLLTLLVENKRLTLAPDIYLLYEKLRAEQEKIAKVSVTSFSSLSAEQEASLTRSLSQRLKRQVTLQIQIDKTLLGGIIIQAGDLIIDGSVRGQLNKLRNELAA